MASSVAALVAFCDPQRAAARVRTLIGDAGAVDAAPRRIDMTSERALERLLAIEQSGVLDRDDERKARLRRDGRGDPRLPRRALSRRDARSDDRRAAARARASVAPEPTSDARRGVARALRHRQVRRLARDRAPRRTACSTARATLVIATTRATGRQPATAAARRIERARQRGAGRARRAWRTSDAIGAALLVRVTSARVTVARASRAGDLSTLSARPDAARSWRGRADPRLALASTTSATGERAIVWKSPRAIVPRRRRRRSSAIVASICSAGAPRRSGSRRSSSSARAASARGSSDLPAVLRVLAVGSLAIGARAARDVSHGQARGRLDRHHDRLRHVEVDGGDRHAARPHGCRAARDPPVPAPQQERPHRPRDLRPAGDAAVPAHAGHEAARADRRATS